VAALRTRARFPEIPPEAGHYESFYMRACHPSEPLGVWIRYTAHKRPGAEPKGSLWFTLFDASAEGPRASKVTLDDLGAGDDHYIRIGESRFEPAGVRGSARTDQLDASWELTFGEGEPAFYHLARNWMYSAKLPRTKLLSPHPKTSFSGRVQAGERSVELDGWPGMVGHNWGAQHAERWIWLHGVAFEGHEDAWFDGALGRIKLGPATTPWIGNAGLHVDGHYHRLGGPERIRSTKVDEQPERCRFALRGKGIAVRGEVSAERKDIVGWVYADPDGPEHNSLHCSISHLRLEVERDGRPPVTLETRHGAAYELGLRETGHGIPIQPFPDG
jgi:hypothetical protein